MAVNNSLAEVIKNAREINGYSQRQLAKELNISNSELSRIESGSRQKPDTEILTKIANIKYQPQPLNQESLILHPFVKMI